MKNILIFGGLAEKYQAEWQLEVKSPAEALRAIDANCPGFLQDATDVGYVCVLVDYDNPDNTRQVMMATRNDLWCDETLAIVPKVQGEFPAVIAAWVAAAAAASITTASIATVALVFEIVYAIAYIAVVVAISAIANLVIGAISGSSATTASQGEAPENKPSYLYNGVINTMRQGHPIPVLYGGPLIVGTMVISVSIDAQDVKL